MLKIKHRLIQMLTAIIYNLNISGFITGKIHKGPTKGFCVPGLNCYSCPGAIGACPLGSLQSGFASLRINKLPFYVLGMLLAFGILFGRSICAFFCPFGMIQELLYKIPSRKIQKSKWSRRLSLTKYAVLAVFVLVLPPFFLFRHGVVVPTFCKYICPAGTFEGGVPLILLNENMRHIAGLLFIWKVGVLVFVFAASVCMYRFFCRFICPLGAIYSLFNKYAVFGFKVDTNKCVNCNKCVRACKLDVNTVNDRECIRCGECKASCPQNAVQPNE